MKAPKPLRRVPALRLPLVLAGLAAMQAVAAAEPEPEFIPGHPWTTVVPDPDKFDWSAQVRPGYRYRGMTPNAERAYKYIQDKRARGVALNWGERYMVRFLQSARVWPEPPMPPPAVVAFLRHLRSLTREELNLAERMMLGDIIHRGMFPDDQPVFEEARRIAEYLQCGHFEARNWFERWYGRVEIYMDVSAAQAFDMRVDVDAPQTTTDVVRIAQGVPTPDGSYWKLARIVIGDSPPEEYETTVSGGDEIVQVRCPYPWFEPDGTPRLARQVATMRWRPYAQRGLSYMKPGWKVSLLLQVSSTLTGIAPGKPPDPNWPYFAFGSAALGTQNLTSAFDGLPDLPYEPMAGNVEHGPTALVKFDVPDGAVGNEMQLSFTVMGAQAGTVTCFWEWFDNADQRAVEQSEWQAHVEDTLKKMGVTTTPEGRRLKQMRDALAADDKGWKAYMSRESAALAAEAGPKEAAFKQVQDAAKAGGEAWEKYVKANRDKGE